MHTLQQLQEGQLKGNKQLKLSCGLTEFPAEIISLADTLEVLDLSGNQLSGLPDNFAQLSKLKIAFFSDNLFTELPPVLGQCKQLTMIGFKSNRIALVSPQSLPPTTRWLILTNNKIQNIPSSIGNCLALQKVAFAGNLLTSLPREMANCRNLELLRISANNFNELPQWLLHLPKLSWLAVSGNPFSSSVQTASTLPQVDWNEFEILEQLGEGASGHIYKAALKNQTEHSVAIKVFKGDVTSDGFPEDEMLACSAAGNHPNLVNVLAVIKNHPQNKQGLILSLIPESFRNLGLPPSMETCSRDTFNAGTVFTSAQILIIASGIASASQQLHQRGIMHGDLYAHNILIDGENNCLMGDFGAASFYDTTNTAAKNLQQLESRAFGCLIDDMLTRVSQNCKTLALTRSLEILRDDCMQEHVGRRPLFGEIQKRLKAMQG